MMVQGIMFQKFDPRAAYFDPVIDMLKDTGLMSYFFDKLMPPKNMRETISSVEEPLVLDHFYLPIIIWSCGLVLGIVFHILEHSLTKVGLRRERRKDVKSVLRDDSGRSTTPSAWDKEGRYLFGKYSGSRSNSMALTYGTNKH